MELTRRELLIAGAAGALGATGCSTAFRGFVLSEDKALEPPRNFDDPDTLLLHRIGFGPAPGDLQELKSQGRRAYVERQLQAAAPERFELQFRLARLDVLRLTESDLRDIPERIVLEQLQQASLLRAVYSPNQLLERMVDFWTNHFNIYARKGYAAWRKPVDESEVIRKHALGRFSDLLRASAHSPAMLAYLDNQVNRKGVPNENYARELMELHSLGVHGGYTQQDVREVARCFTGWSIENRFLRPRGRFRFIPENHDDGEKVVLGHRIRAGGGKADGDKVLEILASHPATARHIGTKLARYVLGPEAEPWPGKLADLFLQTQGDIRTLLRPMLLSEEMKSAPPVFKRPFDYVVSSLRAFGGETDGGRALQAHLETMGQPLFQWPMPDGYPDHTAAWTGSMLARWNYALALAEGRIPGTRLDLDRIPGDEGRARIESASRLSVSHLGEGLRAAISRCGSVSEAVAVCLASPEFQWR